MSGGCNDHLFKEGVDMELFYTGTILRGGKSFLREFRVYKEADYLLWELTQGQVMKVDVDQFNYLVGVTWNASKATNKVGFYVSGGATNKSSGFKVHQYLAGLQYTVVKSGVEVDHINGDALDNRLSNLRLSTRKQQQLNTPHRNTLRDSNGLTSTFRGVRRNRCGNWQTGYNTLDNKWRTAGTYSSEEGAARAWDIAVYKEYEGHNPLKGLVMRGIRGCRTLDFIRFNFPEELPL